jgi:phosphoribosylamine--glycine ligase
MQDDLLPWLLGAARGDLPAGPIAWRAGAAVCVVLAAPGYPAQPRLGEEIAIDPGLDARDSDVIVFHAGTRRSFVRPGDTEGPLLTSSGRVLGVTARGSDLGGARATAYKAIRGIHFAGMHFRRDIGARGEKKT